MWLKLTAEYFELKLLFHVSVKNVYFCKIELLTQMYFERRKSSNF